MAAPTNMPMSIFMIFPLYLDMFIHPYIQILRYMTPKKLSAQDLHNLGHFGIINLITGLKSFFPGLDDPSAPQY